MKKIPTHTELPSNFYIHALIYAIFKDMDRNLKPIPTGNPNLREIIEKGNLYVDKTKYIYNLIAHKSIDNVFFLSRPRRFGKSLTIDTLENIFNGNRDLFKGLYIYDKYDFEEYPVIRLNMSLTPFSDLKELLSNLYELQIYDVAEKHGIADCLNRASSPSVWLHTLIKALREKYKKNVVVLIDEYDNSLLKTVYDKVLFEQVKNMFAGFYEILKTDGEYIRFCFITGITRFQQVSIFSQLNNLIDISSAPEYAAICGYTDEEFDYYFDPYIQKYYEEKKITKKEEKKAFRRNIKDYYDGYRFSIRSDVTIYNPVSIGKFFNGGCSFDNFWIETGAQSLVNEMIERHPEIFRASNEFSVPISKTTKFEVRRIFTEHPDTGYMLSYLLQAGYLTIKREEAGDYVLSYPNLEVKDAMDAAVLSSYGLDFESERVAALRRAFRECDTEEIIKVIYNSFTTYPYHLTLDREKGFQIAVFSILRMCVDARAEDVTNNGRIDITVKVDDYIYYITELKLDGSAESALKQIKDKRYYEKYMKKGNTIHLLGINFSSKKRNITEWKEDIIKF